MKHFILVLMITLLYSTTASAFKPGPDIIRECPKCNAPLKQATMMSGNTFRATFWTDGKKMASMLPDRQWLVKCPKCDALFWIDEAKQLGEQWPRDNKQWPDAIKPSIPTEADYLGLLGDSTLPQNKKLYLRRRAWWAANDIARTNVDATVVWSAAQQANLRSLATLMDEKDPDQRITKAEIFRELKRFDDCISLLSRAFEEERHAEVAAFIKRLAEQGIWTVREINPERKLNKPSESTR
jgi:hypothetical protein